MDRTGRMHRKPQCLSKPEERLKEIWAIIARCAVVCVSVAARGALNQGALGIFRATTATSVAAKIAAITTPVTVASRVAIARVV